MKPAFVFLIPALLGAGPAQQLLDNKMSLPQRAAACLELRGHADPDAVSALVHALQNPDLLTCAAEDLRVAGATEPLQRALTSDNFQLRAAAARELGVLQRPELLEPLARAAQDENVLVASNALAGLSQYRDPAVIPYLTNLARTGGMTGDMALDRLSQLDSTAAVGVARGLLGSLQVPDRLYAMRILGASGDRSDLPALQKIVASQPETLAQRDRGFGFMPAINLARAAREAIAAIEAREPASAHPAAP